MARRSVSIDVELEEVFSEADDTDVAAECRSRGVAVLSRADLEEVSSRLAIRDLYGALLVLDRVMPPVARNFAFAFTQPGVH